MKSRLGLVRFADWVRMSHWAVALVAVVVVVFLRRANEWRSGEIWVAVGILGLWLAAGWLVSRLRRPDSLKALAILDERGGWKDCFSSAWAFLTDSDGEKDQGTRLHLSRAEKILPDAVSGLRQSLPVPSLKWAWALPLLAIVFAMSPMFRRGLDAGDALLTGDMQEAAAGQADVLKGEGDKIAGLDSLSKEERERIEKLRAEVNDTAENLTDTDGQTATEVLEALETRARAAEKLAESLGAANEDWASDAMLAEMSQHPDTADLALAIKDKQAEPAADESEKLFQVLDDVEIKRETSDRITAALDRTMEQATEEDRTRPVGERVGNASTKLLDQQPKTAAREFEELAKYFRVVKNRENAREKLEELAGKLRDAGSQISGSKLQKMQKLASSEKKPGNAPQGLKPLDSNPLANQIQNMTAPQTMQPGQAGAPAPGKGKKGQATPVPGAPQNGKGKENSQQALAAPVPGTELSGGKGKGGAGQGNDGKEKGKGNGRLLSAPVPGMAPGSQSAAASLGASGQGQGNGSQGGDQAGEGTAELVDSPSDILKAARDSKVVAQVNKDGDSTTRAVEGGARTEEATLSRQEVMAEFIAVEEQALDGQPLPLTRRNHVLRYFSALRKEFEKPDGND